MAMTAEKLHEKCHIAAELAHRDMRIAELEAWIESHREEFTDQRIVSNTEIDQILGKVSHEQS